MSRDFDNSQSQETVQHLLRAGGIGATILVGIAGFMRVSDLGVHVTAASKCPVARSPF